MDSIPCLWCSVFFIPRNKLQQYCSKPECQRKRKALWQKEKIQRDPEYKEIKNLSNQKWLNANPDYWKNYRRKNPKKTQRNRMLQKVRNHRKNSEPDRPITNIIAKMDARKPLKVDLEGWFWLIPEIAKMDAAKVLFHVIQECYE